MKQLAVLVSLSLVPLAAQRPPIVREVRVAINKGDIEGAKKALAAARGAGAPSPAWLEAQSWIGRGLLAAKRFDEAERAAAETRDAALAQLKTRQLDDEPSLPTALGAAIETQALALNARGQKTEAVALLGDELKRWHATSIRTRLQKNLHLISLVGKPAPALEGGQSLKGRQTLLFFWAHWCGDCKAMAPILAQLKTEFPKLAIVAPTQPYGYVARGAEATRAEEVSYIGETWRRFYPALQNVPTPISEENFKAWGSSTTPTLVLVDEAGIVRLYHPGNMSYEELAAALAHSS